MQIRIIVNGRPVEREIEADMRLLDLLRDGLHLTGTKEGCGEGECGACTVLLDGQAVNSCLILAAQVDGKEILTVEGISKGNTLHPIQQAFVEEGAVQCGFCTPGFIVSTYALLKSNPAPSDQEITSALTGNLCRCTGYVKIVDAVHHAAKLMHQKEGRSRRAL
ncbi:(2Fe-2S)-binding protein [Candidatus Bipolaricaulota bacterium]|nr:(2Fe-2S)-binding protein [Candidatus Bipolaricaulota bacterium]